MTTAPTNSTINFNYNYQGKIVNYTLEIFYMWFGVTANFSEEMWFLRGFPPGTHPPHLQYIDQNVFAIKQMTDLTVVTQGTQDSILVSRLFDAYTMYQQGLDTDKHLE